jgi:hypothetical protein
MTGDTVPAAGQAPAEDLPRRYRQRGNQVEAVRLTAVNGPAVREWTASRPHYAPDGAIDGLTVYGTQGREYARPGDWIVRFPAGFRVLTDDEFTAAFEEAPAPRMRPGDQQFPVANDGPSMHDLVVADIGEAALTAQRRTAIRQLMAARKQIGIDRYGSLLQAGNGRDAQRDVREELADAAVYARQIVEETCGDPAANIRARRLYRIVLSALYQAYPA